MHIRRLSIFFAVSPGIGTGDSEGQLGCSSHNGFAVLGGDIGSNPDAVGFVAHQQHLESLTL